MSEETKNMTRIERFANSKFMKGLDAWSIKLSKSPAFSTLTGGMGATMGLIMIGAVIMIICTLGSMIFGWESTDPIYQAIYLPYNLTMGMLSFFMCFSLAYSYAKKLKVPTLQSGFVAMICYILVAAPPATATLTDGTSITALNLGSMGTTGLFVAIIIGLASVRITKLCTDKHLVIRMPDVVPEGVLNSFNSIIPAGINIIFWYGLSLLVSNVTHTTLPNIIIYLLSIPMNFLISPVGMVFIVALGQLFWFFGIHGTGVIFTVIMVPYIAAYSTNAELYASNLPLMFNFVFLYGCNAMLGGAGNVLPLCVLGLRSKSERIKAISKASLVPSLFNISEPVVFGYPIMYNPLLLIPYVACPLIVMAFLAIAYYFQLISFPHVLIMTCLPIGVTEYLSTMDIRNVLFVLLMIPVCFLVYYPFFKMYEKKCIQEEKESAEAAE